MDPLVKLAYVRGLIEELEKFAKFIEQGGIGQTFPGMQHQGLAPEAEGIHKMKRLQKKQKALRT